MGDLNIVVWTLAGIAAGTVLSCIPGLHVASVLGLLIFLFGEDMGFNGAVPFVVSLVCAFSIVGFVPMVALSVPDESLFFAVTPAQAMNRDGRGLSVILIGGMGVLVGTCLTALAVLVFRHGGIVAIMNAMRPHWHWMLWAAVLFMLMSEWPQRVAPGLSPMERFVSVWKVLGAGLLVFVLSGILGMIVFHGRVAGLESSFAGLMPMLSGMFSVPCLLLTLTGRDVKPFMDASDGKDIVGVKDIMAGGLSGWMGGCVAVLMPGVTAGVGGMLAGHATAINRRNAFVIAQGAARGTYLTGGLLLMFSPGVTATRGGCAMMLRSVHEPFPQLDLVPVAAVALAATGLCLVCVRFVYKCFFTLISLLGMKLIVLLSLAAVIYLNWFITGLWGLCVMMAASMIGGWAISIGSRRLNCLGCILVPVGFALSRIGG